MRNFRSASISEIVWKEPRFQTFLDYAINIAAGTEKMPATEYKEALFAAVEVFNERSEEHKHVQ